jgi:hypothetical protein
MASDFLVRGRASDLGILLHEFSDTPAGDLAVAIASGLLLPSWALMLALVDRDLLRLRLQA